MVACGVSNGVIKPMNGFPFHSTEILMLAFVGKPTCELLLRPPQGPVGNAAAERLSGRFTTPLNGSPTYHCTLAGVTTLCGLSSRKTPLLWSPVEKVLSTGEESVAVPRAA